MHPVERTRHTIDQHQRIAGVDGGGTTHTEGSGRVGLATTTSHGETRHNTLQSLRDTHRLALRNRVTSDHAHRTGQVALLGRTITDDHHLVERFGILLQTHFDIVASGKGDGLRRVANVGDLKLRIGWYIFNTAFPLMSEMFMILVPFTTILAPAISPISSVTTTVTVLVFC